MCAAIIAYIPFNCYQQKHLKQKYAVKHDRTASSGGLWPLPGQQ